MHIDSSTIGMESARSFASVSVSRLSVTAQGSVLRPEENRGTFKGLLSDWADNTGKEDEDLAGLRNSRTQVYSASSIHKRNMAQTLEEIRVKCVMYLMELFFKGRHRMEPEEVSVPQTQQPGVEAPIQELPKIQGSGSYTSYYAEQEKTDFQASGKVVTKDGKEISFGIGVTMSRAFEEFYEQRFGNPNAVLCDPLVINLNQNVAGLTDQKFHFDLDQDGVLDSISQLSQGSGYLALDRNGDGIINDGGELFGTKSGDGFKDLLAYDDDGDGWIDEDDEIFDKLLIWSKNEKGEDMLYHLKEAGVGAICLSNVGTNFALNGAGNQTNGYIRNTGVFLYENGEVGTVQHIDVAK